MSMPRRTRKQMIGKVEDYERRERERELRLWQRILRVEWVTTWKRHHGRRK